MKVMNKTKEYIAIEVRPDSRRFYIDIGKYLRKEDYKIDSKENERYNHEPLTIKEQSIYNIVGSYILVDTETKNCRIISKEEFEQDYVQLQEDNK